MIRWRLYRWLRSFTGRRWQNPYTSTTGLKQSVRSRQKMQQEELVPFKHLKEEYVLVAEDETSYMLNRLKSIISLWDSLCEAAHEGRPQCLHRIIDIAHQAGIIENDSEKIDIVRQNHQSGKFQMDADGILTTSKSFVVYSAHHEAVGKINLSSDESNILFIIIWALEGQLFLRE
jgi:hypothetical protein